MSKQQARQYLDHELSWRAGTKQKAHDQGKIVAGDVDEIALVQILAATQPGTTHAATIKSKFG